MNNRSLINDFLLKYNQHPDNIDIAKTVADMLDEMEIGLQGKDCSLLMIPTYLSTDGEVKYNDSVITIDAGGTNLRTALVTLTEEGTKVDFFQKRKMYGIDEEMTWDEFIENIVQLILPMVDKSNKIGFCFSYPADMMENKDGKVIMFTKGINITNCEGKVVGQSIKDCLKKHGVDKEMSFVLLNDTVSTLLGGPNIINEEVDGQIGLILGTGTNTAYTEDIPAIEKLHSDNNGKMIINMESGNFNRIPLGEFDIRADAKGQPGFHLFEKGISGLYLGHVVSEAIYQAADEGFFSAESKLKEMPYISSVEIDKFLRQPYGDNLVAKGCGNSNDVELVYNIIDFALERGAKLVCCNLAAVIEKMDGGKKISAPCRIVAEGSTFYKCYSYKEKIEYYMKDYVNGVQKRYYKFVSGDDVNLVGSALAALLNS